MLMVSRQRLACFFGLNMISTFFEVHIIAALVAVLFDPRFSMDPIQFKEDYRSWIFWLTIGSRMSMTRLLYKRVIKLSFRALALQLIVYIIVHQIW